MFTNLKAKNYKGISEIKLDGLGNINIICGKNNSGKTSILEALSSAKGFAIGRKVNSTEWLEELFAPEADRYTNPDPGVSKRWFKNYIAGLIQSQAVWYSDEYETIINDIYISIKKEPSLNHYNNNLFNIDKVLDKYFDISKYKPILIPAKRILNYEDIIDLQSINTPNGHKIINRLFLLKNQIENSIEFKKYNKIYSAFEVITGYSFNIKAENKNNIKIYFKKDPYEWLEGDACGLGLSDILILVTFSIDSDCSMIFIEEPENHLHPEMQKKFLNFIRGIKSKQFILSTHSNIFLNPNIVDKIFYVSFLNNVRASV
ncbi:MAG: AAA family ATPase [Methanothrix sp.]|nr:AAA family ATPase [Methanothrix sp.]